MGIIGRVLRSISDMQPIGVGSPLGEEPLWAASVPGFTAHFLRIHGPSSSLFLSDGWGVTFASLRFRRYDLRTGQEVAGIRTGTAVRCIAVLPGETEIVAASDSKLFRLELRSLTELERWDKRIPRYSDSIAVLAGQAVVANWRRPGVGIVDLASGSVRRRSSPGLTKVIARQGGDPLLLGGDKGGGLWSIEPRAGTVTALVTSPPAIDAVVDPRGDGIWMTVGIRATYTESSSGPGRSTRQLRRYSLKGMQQVQSFHLPQAVDDVLIGKREMWLASPGSLVALPLPVGSGEARVWHPPKEHFIRAFDPDTRVVVASRERPRTDNAVMTAFALG
jgi:hypothetical protein